MLPLLVGAPIAMELQLFAYPELAVAPLVRQLSSSAIVGVVKMCIVVYGRE